jgi:hypothetical protein
MKLSEVLKDSKHTKSVCFKQMREKKNIAINSSDLVCRLSWLFNKAEVIQCYPRSEGNIVACLLKARIGKPAETAIARERSITAT